MSSIKFDEELSENVVKILDGVSIIIEDATADINTFVSGLPSDTTIDNKIYNKCVYYEEEEVDGVVKRYKRVDEGKRTYLEGAYKAPMKEAALNLSTLSTNLSTLKNTVDDMDSRVKQIQEIVAEYEANQVNVDTDGLLSSSTTTTGGGHGQGDTTQESTTEHEWVCDVDTDGDGKPDLNIDTNGDGIPDLNIDTDGDGKPDLNIDTNHDGIPDLNVDTDGDGKPDLNVDTNGDGIPDLNVDTNGDGKPDVNVDTNGDGVPDVNIDTNGDGKPDTNIDTNGDGIPDVNIDTNGDGKPDINVDTNGDGIPDVNIDTNGDGKPDINVDTNGDGIPDINIDIDGDGKPDLNIDTDGDGKPDKNIDADGDGVIDSTVPVTNPNGNEDEEDGTTTNDETDEDSEGSDLFDGDDADDSSDGFADNIVAGSTGDGTGDGTGTGSGNGSGNGTNGGVGGIWGTGASGSGNGSGEGGLFPFLPGSSTSADGENPDFIYRGLYDQSGDGNYDMSQIKYNAIGEGGAGIAKGAAVAGAVGLGVSGADAVATLNENRKMEEDVSTSSEEKEEKKRIKTIVSSSILGLVAVGYVVASLMPNTSILAIILLGVAMAISSVTATSGLKIGKYIGFGVPLFVAVLSFVLSSCGVISPLGYIVVFATFVILSIAAFLLDLLKGMFDDKIELVPIIIALAVGMFFGMLKVLDIIGWVLFLILLVLTVGGYFLWEKVIKDKLPDDDDDDEVVDNVIYKPAQYTENSPMNAPEQEKFDPRSLYKEDDANNKEALDNMANNQNPFANYDPKNSSFDNAFKDDNNNNNGMF